MWRCGQVARLPAAGPHRHLEVAAEAVAALARNHVEAHAAGRGLGADPRGLVADLLVHRVVEVALDGAVGLQAVDHHAVHQHRDVGRGHAVRGHVGLLHRARAAGVRQAQVDADHELAHALDAAAGRNRRRSPRGRGPAVWAAVVTSTTGEAPVTVIVSSSAPTRRSALMVAVNSDGSSQIVAPEGLEARQRERHRVGARPQIGDAVGAVAVGDRRLDLLDEDVARRLDRHAGQHRAGRVLDDADNRALRVGNARQEHRPANATSVLVILRAILSPPMQPNIPRRLPPAGIAGP